MKLKKEISDFLKFAIENNRVKDVKEAFEEFPPENEKIKKAQEELDYLTGDEEERRLAELREKAIKDEISGLNCARKEGEKNSKLDIAKKLKEMKFSIADIEDATGLTKEEIESL